MILFKKMAKLMKTISMHYQIDFNKFWTLLINMNQGTHLFHSGFTYRVKTKENTYAKTQTDV